MLSPTWRIGTKVVASARICSDIVRVTNAPTDRRGYRCRQRSRAGSRPLRGASDSIGPAEGLKKDILPAIFPSGRGTVIGGKCVGDLTALVERRCRHGRRGLIAVRPPLLPQKCNGQFGERSRSVLRRPQQFVTPSLRTVTVSSGSRENGSSAFGRILSSLPAKSRTNIAPFFLAASTFIAASAATQRVVAPLVSVLYHGHRAQTPCRPAESLFSLRFSP